MFREHKIKRAQKQIICLKLWLIVTILHDTMELRFLWGNLRCIWRFDKSVCYNRFYYKLFLYKSKDIKLFSLITENYSDSLNNIYLNQVPIRCIFRVTSMWNNSLKTKHKKLDSKGLRRWFLIFILFLKSLLNLYYKCDRHFFCLSVCYAFMPKPQNRFGWNLVQK